MLKRMRVLIKNNPGLGFEDMFWNGSSTSRPPDRHEGRTHSQASDAMQLDNQERLILDSSIVQTGLSQPAPSSCC